MHRRITLLLLAGCLRLAAQSYDYDDADRLIRVAYPGGGGVAYTYDDSNNMTSSMPLALPAAPSGVEVTRLSPTSARVSWTPDAAPLGYIIERQQVGASSWEEVGRVGRGVSTLTDPNLQPGVAYNYRVIALGQDGPSAPSPAAAFSGPPRPSIAQNGVVNGASFAHGQPIAPGSIISIFGDNIGARLTTSGLEAFEQGADSVPLPATLGGASLTIGGEPAPLFFIGGQAAAALDDQPARQGVISGQLNAQVPWEAPLGIQPVVVSQTSNSETASSESAMVSIALVSPALFTFDFGPGRAAAINIATDANGDVINGSIAQVENAFPGVASQPAKLGGVVTLFANGLGPVEPPGVTGENSIDALREVTVPVQVLVGGAEAQVLFAGLAPQFVGLYQINVVIPLGAIPGDEVPVSLVQGGLNSRTDVTIALRP